MALIVIVVIAYLSNTRIDRATSVTYSARLRAQTIAESGLAAAIHLLRDNTRYGNYVTAMPPTSVANRYTELYRPHDPADTAHGVMVNDFLTLSNASGEFLISRASPTPAAPPIPQVDPRPTPEVVTTPTTAIALTPLGLTAADSYDFNQIFRMGTSATGRLVNPDGLPAYGQWIRVRNNSGELIGRYAFFIEDESMKVNVNSSGNNLALPSPTASPNLRVNDAAPVPATTPATQIQEIDPTAVLLAANRRAANTSLVALGNPNARLSTKLTMALLSNWTSIENYAHLLTVFSKDDNTTAKGWQRLDLNKIVADAEAIGTNAAKVTAATRIADWIRDAWTGPTVLSTLQYSQLFNDSRLRLQIAANIVDYIDQDNVPTDMGDVVPDGYTNTAPVIGIEKIPYLVAVEVIYQASNSTCPSPPVPGTYSATLKMKLQFRFLNLFDSALDPLDSIGKIEVKGVPVVTKNGPLTPPFDFEAETFTVTLADLKPVTGTGSCSTAGACIVPAGIDGTSDSGAKTVQTDWLKTQSATFTVSTSDQNPKFQAGQLTVKVFGKTGERLDETSIALNGNSTGYTGPNSTKDFLTDATPTNGSLQIASINLVYGTSFETGDPRFRGPLVNERWRNINRTDASLPLTTNRISLYIDKAELNPRASGMDWYDESGDRPLAYIRNGAMLNIGELGHISSAEYPWRTLYLQHPERPANTSQTGPKDDVPLRRSQSQDYVLVDLFRAGGTVSRSGALNINTQQQFLQPSATTATLPLHSLLLGIPVGATAPTILTQAAPAAAASPADRVSTGVNLLVTSTTIAQNSGTGTTPQNYRIASVSNKRNPLAGEATTPDNNPNRPFFQVGDLAPTLSRLISASEASDTSASSSRSKVVYSALRTNPQSTTTNQNYRKDFQVEQLFREVSNSITTRGNVFRVLYVGQTIKDIPGPGPTPNGQVDSQREIISEYLGEALIERQAVFAPEATNPDGIKTSDSVYKILANRVITE
jgi:hypothetical protein